MIKWLWEKISGYCWHEWIPDVNNKGFLSFQKQVCHKCGKKRRTPCHHVWGKPWTTMKFHFQFEEDGKVWTLSSPRQIVTCKRCGVHKTHSTYQR